MVSTVPLSREYEAAFERTLAEVSAAATELDVPLVPFWPIRGAAYDGELLVIGRSVNGWVEDWTSRQLRDSAVRRQAVAWLRRDAEPSAGDRMGWVTDFWGARSGYNTRRSALWRVLRRISGGDDPAADWPSRLIWTNLYKVSPGAGWNPHADLQRAQRRSALELLKIEIAEFKPRRILAVTGNWIAPFADGLGLAFEPRPGLVEGVAEVDGCAWVIAKHPMRKPEGRFVNEVRGAFEELGARLPAR
jgi:hypothetical protein